VKLQNTDIYIYFRIDLFHLIDFGVPIIVRCFKKHAAIACERNLELIWIDATHLEEFSDAEFSIEEKQKRQEDQDAAWSLLKSADGVIVPGGFGNRGFEGKMKAAEYCRVHKKPYLGVCLGFQAMVVEYARNVMGWTTANSTEFDESTEHPTVIFMPEVDATKMGGTMRLGERTTQFLPSEDGSNNDKPILSSKIQKLYGSQDAVRERHRHRYEVNPELAPIIHDAGLKFVGRDTTGTRMQVAELDTEQHPYYVACQYHPEFKSRPLHPSPPFHGLVLASSGLLTKHLSSLS
jgi:CTP synthase